MIKCYAMKLVITIQFCIPTWIRVKVWRRWFIWGGSRQQCRRNRTSWDWSTCWRPRTEEPQMALSFGMCSPFEPNSKLLSHYRATCICVMLTGITSYYNSLLFCVKYTGDRKGGTGWINWFRPKQINNWFINQRKLTSLETFWRYAIYGDGWTSSTECNSLQGWSLHGWWSLPFGAVSDNSLAWSLLLEVVIVLYARHSLKLFK